MTLLDTLIVVAYLLAVLIVGLACPTGQHSTRDTNPTDPGGFMLGGRVFGSLLVGVSVMVTTFSALNFAAFPTEVAANGLYILACVPVFLLIAFPVTRWIIPAFVDQGYTSAYQLLEEASTPVSASSPAACS
ncbi:SLC5/6 family protein [Mucisphaera calidilacus]|uniref:Uncharacterized protein n=1 Tax=Mucisphaera calidilacus TaxID=2527982 RepID=A0A518C0V2_9BACT|nr:hypothetical protein [Mucisphaera calidilacus]QDU72824.1 hypothetical protein Pan265_26990 [Mucisphaera calidilacus]